MNGSFLKLAAGTSGMLESGDVWLRAAVVAGAATHEVPGVTAAATLETGSYFASRGAASHTLACTADTDCTFYLRTEGRYRFTPDR